MSETPVVRTWFYSIEGKSFGPVTENELVALARAGEFRPNDHVYAPHFGNWVLAKTVHGLFDSVGFDSVADDEPAESAPLYVPGPGSPFGPEVTSGLAGFWTRVLAEFIDNIILALPTLPITYFFALLLYNSSFGGYSVAFDEIWRFNAFTFVLWLVWIGLRWPYYVLLEASPLKGTLGKRMVGLEVTDIYGRRISFTRATVRYLASTISMLAAFCGYLTLLVTARKQTLHDIISGTIVIDTELRLKQSVDGFDLPRL